MNASVWPKRATYWSGGEALFVSIPFTWDLPEVHAYLSNGSLFPKPVLVGGPAVKLMPGYFRDLPDVVEGYHLPGVLQRVNPLATKTSVGCPNACPFCAVPRIEGRIQELEDWPDLPIICDNNLLACSTAHFDRAMDRLEKHKWCDFNQGVDASLITRYHAERFARLKKPMIRLAFDNLPEWEDWSDAVSRLLSAGVPKSRIRSYVLIGFNDDPATAWRKCKLVEDQGLKALPMWFHALDAMERNIVTEKQIALGWNDKRRRSIMQWFYKHKRAVE